MSPPSRGRHENHYGGRSAATRGVHSSALFLGEVQRGAGIFVGPFAVIGATYRRVAGEPLPARQITRLGDRCEVGPHARVLRGSHIGKRVSVDGGCTVEQDVDVGDDSRLIYHCIVCNSVRIGRHAIIGGFIGERSRVGDYCRVFGQLVHRQDDPAVPWDDQEEDPPTLEDHVLVGFGAIIIGGVTVGSRSCISAGAVVTRNVPRGSIVSGTNQIVHYSDCPWRVARSAWFSDE